MTARDYLFSAADPTDLIVGLLRPQNMAKPAFFSTNVFFGIYVVYTLAQLFR